MCRRERVGLLDVLAVGFYTIGNAVRAKRLAQRQVGRRSAEVALVYARDGDDGLAPGEFAFDTCKLCRACHANPLRFRLVECRGGNRLFEQLFTHGVEGRRRHDVHALAALRSLMHKESGQLAGLLHGIDVCEGLGGRKQVVCALPEMSDRPLVAEKLTAHVLVGARNGLTLECRRLRRTHEVRERSRRLRGQVVRPHHACHIQGKPRLESEHHLGQAASYVVDVVDGVSRAQQHREGGQPSSGEFGFRLHFVLHGHVGEHDDGTACGLGCRSGEKVQFGLAKAVDTCIEGVERFRRGVLPRFLVSLARGLFLCACRLHRRQVRVEVERVELAQERLDARLGLRVLLGLQPSRSERGKRFQGAFALHVHLGHDAPVRPGCLFA